MTDFLEKLKKSVEEGYTNIRTNAMNFKETAGEYGKIAKLKYELYQLKSAHEKKMALLGKTVFPYLLENNVNALNTHETLQILLDEIKNITNQIELLQKAIEDISQKEKTEKKKIQDYDKMRKEVDEMEKQIEAHLKEIQEVKKNLKNKK